MGVEIGVDVDISFVGWAANHQLKACCVNCQIRCCHGRKCLVRFVWLVVALTVLVAGVTMVLLAVIFRWGITATAHDAISLRGEGGRDMVLAEIPG